MAALLFALHALFFSPVVPRLLRGLLERSGQPTVRGGGPPPVSPAVHLVLAIHGAGLALLYAGLVRALVTGRITNRPTRPAVLGAAVLAGAAGLVTWSFRVFTSWRLLPTIDSNHELCTDGPYRLVRHPIYLAVDLLAVGSAVWVPTRPVITAAALLIAGADLRARAEERQLLRVFGETYERYARRTSRTIPGIY